MYAVVGYVVTLTVCVCFPMRVGEVVEKRFLTHKVEDVWEVRG